MTKNRILGIIIFLGIFLSLFISKGYEMKKAYDKAVITDKEVISFFQNVTENIVISIVKNKDNNEIFLSDKFHAELINSLHNLRGYGPNHPIEIDVYELVFEDIDFTVELTHSLISNKERVYLNVIYGDKNSSTFKEYRYISDELNIWAKNVGIIKN